MKTLNRLLKEFFLLQRFQIQAFMLLLMFSLSSCFQKYYKTNTMTVTDSANLQKLINEKKSFIIHGPDGVLAVKNAKVGTDAFYGDKEALNPISKKYVSSLADSSYRLNMKHSGIVLNEVHLYSNCPLPTAENVTLNINQIYRVDVNEFDKKATKDAKTLSIVGISGAFVAVVAIIASGGHSPNNSTHFWWH
jgi:hypothetical protein